MVAGLPVDSPTIKSSQKGEWVDLHVLKILFPPSDKADIAVLKTGQDVVTPFKVAIVGENEGVTFGQPVWFLGYPFLEALHTRTSNFEFPFIKKGILSAINSTDEHAVVMYIDGFNNKGFSGGPILFCGFGSHEYRILAVVSSYRNATAEANINGQKVDTNILVNSGILVSYWIRHAIEAIEKEEPQK